MFQSDIDERAIRERISSFRARAIQGMTEADCMNTISSIFGNSYSVVTQMRSYPLGTIFYRVRTIPDDDTILPLRTISQVEDAWEPPPQFVKAQGRLNSVNQSLLYCCPGDFNLAIDEARARNSKFVAVMVYKALKNVNVCVIGDYAGSNLPKDNGSTLFYSFLEEEFARIPKDGEEGAYSITRAVADTFFNLPEQDAWCYRSVQSSQKFNVAFLPGKAKSCLPLSGVMICNLHDSKPESLSVKLVADFDPNTGTARYHSIGSVEQKQLFPEIA